MNSNLNQMTAQIPFGFGMPSCGHASDAIEGHLAVVGTAGVVAVVRDRHESTLAIAGTTLGYADKSFPGTTAWRPPLS